MFFNILSKILHIYLLVCVVWFFIKLEYWYREGNKPDRPPAWLRFFVTIGAGLFLLHFIYIGLSATLLRWWPYTWGYYSPRSISFFSYGNIISWLLSFILTLFLTTRVFRIYVEGWRDEKINQEEKGN